MRWCLPGSRLRRGKRHPAPHKRGGGEKARSFPRCPRIRVLPHHAMSLRLPHKERREAGRQKTHRRVPHLAMRRAPWLRSLPLHLERTGVTGTPWSKRARLSAPHRGLRRAYAPRARLLPALPGTTGCKREDPLRHQCSELLADRHWAGRASKSRPRMDRILPPPGTAPAPSSGVPSRRRPS